MKPLLIVIPVLLLIIYALFFNYLDVNEVGIARNWFNGEMQLQTQGLHFSPPWVWVNRMDTKPIKVCVSTSSRGYNAKLVQFNTKYWREFVNTEGWAYYWWYNRLSFNMGYSRNEEFRGFRDVVRGYAYSYRQYPFITTIKEYQE